MQIILLEKVGKLGNLGDVVKVKDGYARNFLIPSRRARRATEAAIKEFEAKRAELEKALAENHKAHPIPIIKTLDGKPLTDSTGKPLKDAPTIDQLGGGASSAEEAEAPTNEPGEMVVEEPV